MSDPPLTVGRLGAVRSSFTVLLEPAVVGSHDDTLPALSTERNCTMVVPSAVITADAPAVVAPHVEPLFVDVRYSYRARPEIVSVAFAAEIVLDAAADQLVEPPETVGFVGSVRSSLTVPCTQADVLPAASMARNCTTVVPCALTVTELPDVDAEKAPPLNDVWYW